MNANVVVTYEGGSTTDNDYPAPGPTTIDLGTPPRVTSIVVTYSGDPTVDGGATIQPGSDGRCRHQRPAQRPRGPVGRRRPRRGRRGRQLRRLHRLGRRHPRHHRRPCRHRLCRAPDRGAQSGHERQQGSFAERDPDRPTHPLHDDHREQRQPAPFGRRGRRPAPRRRWHAAVDAHLPVRGSSAPTFARGDGLPGHDRCLHTPGRLGRARQPPPPWSTRS